MAHRGHNITAISPDMDENPIPNVHYLLIEGSYDKHHKEVVTEMLSANEELNPFIEETITYQSCEQFCAGINQADSRKIGQIIMKISFLSFSKKLIMKIPFFIIFQKINLIDALSSSAIQRLLSYPNDFKFDLVLYDFTIGPCLMAFIHKFNYPPIIGLTAFSNPTFTNDVIGGHHHYSYVPYNVMKTDDHMTFSERLFNFALYMEEIM